MIFSSRFSNLLPYSFIVFDSLNISTPVSLEPWFSKCRSQPAGSASPGNVLEIQVLRPHPIATEAETQEWGGPATCVATRPAGDSDVAQVRTSGLDS